MADGLNNARAMRIAEVINDYTAISGQLAGFQATLSAMPADTAGNAILRQCIREGQALLNRPAPASVANPPSPGEGTKQQLQNIVLDAASRRFRAWRLHQRASCATRWWNRRSQILQGKPASAANQRALSQNDDTLRQEILAVTDQRVFSELNAKDVAAGNWTAEMPTLAKIQQYNSQNP